jgi:hypothetical protein
MPGHAAASGSAVGGPRRCSHAHRACLVRSDAFRALSREPPATDSEIPLDKPFSAAKLT